jgi:hypothetical protein
VLVARAGGVARNGAGLADGVEAGVPEPAPDPVVLAGELEAAEVADDAAELLVGVTGLTVEVADDDVEVAEDVAELTAEVSGAAAELTVEASGVAAELTVDAAEVCVDARGDSAAVAAWAGRVNTSMIARIPAAVSAACIATRAMRRIIGCGMSSSHSTRNRVARLPFGGGSKPCVPRTCCSATTVQQHRQSDKALRPTGIQGHLVKGTRDACADSRDG